MLEFVAALPEVPAGLDFSAHLVRLVQALQPDAIVGFDEIQESTGKFRLTHTDQFSPGVVARYFPVLTELYQENPIYPYTQREDAQLPLRISDLASRRTFHGTGLYQEFFRPLGIEHQMHIVIPTSGWITSLSLNGEADFSDEVVEMFRLLSPQIARQHARFNRPDAHEANCRSLGLSLREGQVLQWIAEGKRNGEIAVIMDLSERTVEKHVANLLRKLGVENRTAAARHWSESAQRWMQPPPGSSAIVGKSARVIHE